MTNWHVRAAETTDLPALERLLAPGVLVTLPEDESRERWLVAEGVDGVEGPAGAAGHVQAPQLVACLRLRTCIGMAEPRPWYHVGCVVHASKHLKLFHRQTILLLGNDHTGAAELADWGWDRATLKMPEQAGLLQLLTRAALLLLARERLLPGGELIVELPGVRDAQGQSPFWEGLGRHFYTGDMRQTAQRHGAHWRTLVASLLPRQAVYTSFLPAATQAAMAQIDPRAGLLADILAAEGLSYNQHITIDDGGPVFSAQTAQLPTLMRARSLELGQARTGASMQTWLVLTDRGVGAGLLRGHLEGQRLCLAEPRPGWLPSSAARVWAVAQTED